MGSVILRTEKLVGYATGSSGYGGGSCSSQLSMRNDDNLMK